MSRAESATAPQLRYITLLCMRLGIRQLLEEQVMTRGEAGFTIHHLKAQARKGGRKHGQSINH
jgi:hypothetical protein